MRKMLLNSALLERVKLARILVVDDSEFGRLLIEGVLRAGGFVNIELAEDGIHALGKIAETKPDLIILDLLMPNMDGFELCRKINEMPEVEDIIVLIQTGLSDVEKRSEVFKLGADDLLIKPVNAEELIARCQHHLERLFLVQDQKIQQNRIAQELYDARNLQLSLLPQQKIISEIESKFGIRIGYLFRPSSELGGDMLGVRIIDESSFICILVDFSGHGVSACLNTIRIHTMFYEAGVEVSNPAAYSVLINSRLYEYLQRGQFATAVIIVYNKQEDALTISTAAAPPFFVLRNEEVGMMELSSLPLGVEPMAYYSNITIKLGKGDSLFVCSDGLTELEKADGALLGEDGVMDYIRKAGSDEKGDVSEYFSDVIERDKMIQNDDLTMIQITKL